MKFVDEFVYGIDKLWKPSCIRLSKPMKFKLNGLKSHWSKFEKCSFCKKRSVSWILVGRNTTKMRNDYFYFTIRL